MTLQNGDAAETGSPSGDLAARLGYTFINSALLNEALIHKSYFNENRATVIADNERLEFLGDSVLSLALSDLLMIVFPENTEGQLSKRRAALVNEDTLCALALELGLDRDLCLGRGEQLSGGASKPRLLASAFEAILGAIYLDRGYPVAREIIATLFQSRLSSEWGSVDFEKDYKTRLQEIVQKNGGAIPKYQVMSENGPEHSKVFEVEVSVGERPVAVGCGKTKKQAEQEAARAAITIMTQGGTHVES